jgi:ATP-dependent protease HslVU (ClpYQ) peptidase subunit
LTTIAYRNGLLAADSQISYGTIRNGSSDKIKVTRHYLVALAGSTYLRGPLERWARLNCPEDEVPDALRDNEDKFQAIFVNEEGDAFLYDHGFLVPINADYAAIGSGATLALGAMAHGASAEEAVRAASCHDKNTGGEVHVLSYSAPRS